MDNITISHFENDAIQEKKLESYGWEKKDFLALGEYRELVSSKATAKQEIDAKVMKVAALEQELKKLKEEADRLKAENYGLQNKVLAAQNRGNAQGDAADGEGSCEE